MLILVIPQILYEWAEIDKTNGFNQILLKHKEKCTYWFILEHLDDFSSHIMNDQYCGNDTSINLLEEIGKHFKTCSDLKCNCKNFVKATHHELNEIKAELNMEPYRYQILKQISEKKKKVMEHLKVCGKTACNCETWKKEIIEVMQELEELVIFQINSEMK